MYKASVTHWPIILLYHPATAAVWRAYGTLRIAEGALALYTYGPTGHLRQAGASCYTA